MSDLSNEFVIDENNWTEHVRPIVDGHQVRSGYVKRDSNLYPQGIYGSAMAFDMPLIPRDQWSERIKEMEATKTRLSDVYKAAGYIAKDQNGQGYCWAYSVTACVQAIRAASNMPFEVLSAHSVACKIKNFKDQGGWGALALDFITENGIVPESLWPAKSMSRSYDTQSNWDEARKYRVAEGWQDMDLAVYDRNLTFEQTMTCLLNRIPVVGDFDWWGHSVCLMDPVETSPGQFGERGINSWTENWGDKGWFVLKGSKAQLNGGVAPRVVHLT